MAIYHLTAKHVSRSEGRSATAAAAYRAGCQLVDQRTGKVHDYTKKRGVMHSEIILPGGGSMDRSALWGGVEKHHKRGDAVPAREVEISLPSELPAEQRQALALAFARELAEKYGVAVDVALHEPRTVTDSDLRKKPNQHWEIDPVTGRRHNGNWHAHILMTACSMDQNGKLGKKVEVLDPVHCQRVKIPNLAERERPRWAEIENAALAAAGVSARVDHRSHEDRGIEEAPSVHLGPAASAYERRTGEKSEARKRREAALEAKAAELAEVNDNITNIEAELAALKNERAAAPAKTPLLDAVELVLAKPAPVPPTPQPEARAPTFLKYLGSKASAVLHALRAVWQGEKPDPVQGFEITQYDSATGRKTKAEPRQRWLSETDYQAAADQNGRIDLDPELLAQCREVENGLTARFSEEDWADPRTRENTALEALETVLRDKI